MMAIEEDMDFNQVENLTGRLSAMGLLGYDLDDNAFFYRRLPFKLNRILSLNPRLKNAEKLITDGKVKILSHADNRVEGQVGGTNF